MIVVYWAVILWQGLILCSTIYCYILYYNDTVILLLGPMFCMCRVRDIEQLLKNFVRVCLKKKEIKNCVVVLIKINKWLKMMNLVWTDCRNSWIIRCYIMKWTDMCISHINWSILSHKLYVVVGSMKEEIWLDVYVF